MVDPKNRYSDPELNPSNKEYEENVDRPVGGDDSDNAVAHDLRRSEEGLGPIQKRLQRRDNKQQPLREAEAAEWNDPKNRFGYKPDDKGDAKPSGSTRQKNAIRLGAAGGVLGLVLAIFGMLLPLKIPGIMQMISDEAGQRVEQITERRAKIIIARAIFQKFATSGSGIVVTGNGPVSTLIASMRTNNFEKKLADKGLTIERSGNGVKLRSKGGYLSIKDGDVTKVIMGNEYQVLMALDGSPHGRALLREIVKEEIPSWRWMKRAKFAKWLRVKYGIPRYGIENSDKSNDVEVIKEMNESHQGPQYEAVAEDANDAINDLMDGEARDPYDPELEGGEGENDRSNSTRDAAAEATAENSDPNRDTTTSLIEKLSAKLSTKAIPVIGWIDFAATVNHIVYETSENDLIGKISSYYRAMQYSRHFGVWSGYGSQIQLGAMNPAFVGVLAAQTEGIEESEVFSMIEGNVGAGIKVTNKINANNVTAISENVKEYTEFVGGYDSIQGQAVNVILEAWYDTANAVFSNLGDALGSVLGPVAEFLTPQAAEDFLAKYVGRALGKILPLIGMDFDPMVTGAPWIVAAHGGATWSYNDFCKVEMGCRKLTPEQTQQQNSIVTTERASYSKQKGLSYSLMSPENSKSLVSRLAVSTPTSTTSTLSKISRVITNAPSTFLGMVTGKTSATAYVDLHGVDPYGALESDLNQPLAEQTITGDECPEVPEGTYNNCLVDLQVAEAMLCEYTPDTEGCDGDTEAVESTSGGGTSFRIASYNIKTGSSQAWNTTSTNNMNENGFQVVGLQEAEIWETYSSISTKAKALGYGIYPDLSNASEATRNGAQARAIVYKTDKFKLVKTDEVTFNRMDDPQQPAHAPIVWLEDIKSGQQVIVMNTHNPAYGYNGGPSSDYNGPKQRYDAAVNYIAKIKQLQAEGLPIFFTGDFNEGWGVRTSLNITLDNDYRNLFYCMLKENDNLLVHAQDVAANKAAVCNQTRSFGPVDHIYVSKGVEVNKYSQLTGTNDQLGTDHDIVPYADVVVPGEESSLNGADIRVATFNILHAPDKDWRDRLHKSVKALTDKQISIAGLQEARPDQQRLFKQSGYGGNIYDMYPDKVTNGIPADENPDSVVIWDKSKFMLVNGRQKSIRYEGGARKVNIVKLRYIENGASGPELYVLNTHDPIDNRSQSGNGPLDRKENNELYYQTIKNELSDAPVIFTGDFNSKMTVSASRNKPLGGLRENLAYCIMTRSNLMVHVSDSQQNKTGCPSQQDVLGRNDVDHIFVSPSVKADGYGIVRRGINGGDHEMVYSNLKIPGIVSTTTGSTGIWGWPLGVQAWRDHRADFLGAHYTGGGFLGGGSSSVDISYSGAAGKPVYSMLDGTVKQQPLGRSSYQCTGTPNSDNNGGMVIQSTVNGKTVLIAYAHGYSPTVKTGDTVKAGQQIMRLGNVGNSCGAHLHMDMSYSDKSICPQDVFLVMGEGQTPDLDKLVTKATPTCGGRL